MAAAAFTTLISATELAALLAREPKPVVIDTSFDLADTAAGEQRFAGVAPARARTTSISTAT